MTPYFGYIRVSTTDQEAGTSLQEQQSAIERFALAHEFKITKWFSETRSAARAGRPIFKAMVQQLRAGKAKGLILHKIDRGARNLRDWADIGDLLDDGIDVRFAHDDLRLDSRGGRLAADIQAVVAADYIRNLREETIKGMRGRLAAGLYPWRAPIGYVDRGGGKPKTPHPVFARLVVEAFSLYATGRYSLRTLRLELIDRGLTKRDGRAFSTNGLAHVLHNPFYAGTIYVRSMRCTYPGVHEPIVSQALFDAVQECFRSRWVGRKRIRQHKYSRLIKHRCGHALVGELQKGRVYYRCHYCPKVCLREDFIDRLLAQEVRVACGLGQKHGNLAFQTAKTMSL